MNHAQLRFTHGTTRPLTLSSLNLFYLTVTGYPARQYKWKEYVHKFVSTMAWESQYWPQWQYFNIWGHRATQHDISQADPQRMSLPSLNFLHLMPVEIQPRQSQDKILTVKVIGSRSKFVSMSHHKVAQLGLPRNVPTKFELPPYGC